MSSVAGMAASAENAVTVQNGVKPSAALIARIKRSYRMALDIAPPPSDSVLWSDLISSKQTDVHDALLRDDDALLGLLSNPIMTNLYYGVDNLARDIPISSDWASAYGSLLIQLQNLSTAMGVVTTFNPEGGSRYPHRTRPETASVEEAVSALDLHFGGALHFANPFAGEIGLATSKGVASYRPCNLSSLFRTTLHG